LLAAATALLSGEALADDNDNDNDDDDDDDEEEEEEEEAEGENEDELLAAASALLIETATVHEEEGEGEAVEEEEEEEEDGKDEIETKAPTAASAVALAASRFSASAAAPPPPAAPASAAPAAAAPSAAAVDAEGEGTLTKPKLADETGEGTLTKPKLERPKEATADPWLVREYVRQLITPEVNEASAKLLSELQRLQERAHLKDPVKAAMRKRYVCGLREVIRSLKTNKARALLVAHNIEKIESEEGLDQLIAELVQLCDMKLEWVYDEQTKRSSQQLVERDGHVPIVFCFTRRTLARCLKRSAKASCVAVLSHDGASDLFHACMREADAARKRYEALTNAPDARLIASDGLCWPPSSGTRRSPTRIRRTASASDASSTSRSGARPNRSRTTSSCYTRSRASGWTKRMAGEGCDNLR